MSLDTAIKGVFAGILDQADAESRDAFAAFEGSPAVRDALAALAQWDTDRYAYLIDHPIEQVTEGLLLKAFPNSSEARFLAGNSAFVERQFRFLIERFEGSSCCVDKTRTIMRKLLRFLATGKEISFDRTAEYTYMLPTKVLADHDEIVAYFKAVYGLYYGRVDRYLAALVEIQKRLAPAAT